MGRAHQVTGFDAASAGLEMWRSIVNWGGKLAFAKLTDRCHVPALAYSVFLTYFT